jgi:CheY-like chemotaxis protein
VECSAPGRLLIMILVNQKVLRRQLENSGIKTYVANHGGEAIETLKQSRYWKGHGSDAVDIGVVLMDKEMPVMDGLQCTSKIREFEGQGLLIGHVPIIAVTANARSEQIATLLEAGMVRITFVRSRASDIMTNNCTCRTTSCRSPSALQS